MRYRFQRTPSALDRKQMFCKRKSVTETGTAKILSRKRMAASRILLISNEISLSNNVSKLSATLPSCSNTSSQTKPGP